MILSNANADADVNSDTGAGVQTGGGGADGWRDGQRDGGAAVRPGPARGGELRTKVFHSSGGLTVINESLNVGKHFISASSVFIRQGQPLAGRERAVTFITARRGSGGTGGRVETSHRPHKNSSETESIPYYYYCDGDGPLHRLCEHHR